jgi:ATP-dependent DNA ligase
VIASPGRLVVRLSRLDSLERGYEGLVGKNEASPYRGGRSLAGLKLKQPHYREDKRGWEPKR